MDEGPGWGEVWHLGGEKVGCHALDVSAAAEHYERLAVGDDVLMLQNAVQVFPDLQSSPIRISPIRISHSVPIAREHGELPPQSFTQVYFCSV